MTTASEPGGWAPASAPGQDEHPLAPGATDGPLQDPSRQSVGELFADVTRDMSTLLRQEVALAKAEATASARRAGKGAGMFAGAGVAGHMVLLFLSIALWWSLGTQIGHGWSALVVAGVWAVVAVVLALAGRAETQKIKGMPETVDSVKKIPHALQGHEEKNS
ncbi:phage holin family protein [Oerskovia paurometabola]|uniref:phage holin family protein n=1 Tax=Oerskovia paurometabola TaxID=162170 RepID=UPI0038223A9D